MRLRWTVSKFVGEPHASGSTIFIRPYESSRIVRVVSISCFILFFWRVLKAKMELAKIEEISRSSNFLFW